MGVKRKIAFLFPGQGAQYVGMGREWATQFAVARQVFDQGDQVLGYPLSELCFHGPAAELQLTAQTQPAVLLTSIAILKVVEEFGCQPDFVAGHSLGEYTALVAAGSLSVRDAVRLVRQRGLLMQEAVPPGQGMMAAFLGLEPEAVQEICDRVRPWGVVEPANYNCPGQIVLAGEITAVEKAMALAKEQGAKRVLPLAVSGPFHSSLLADVSAQLARILTAVPIAAPQVAVVANATASFATTAVEIKDNLVQQVSQAVLWQQSMERLLAEGVTTFIEIGPGSILTGLIKRIAKNVEMYNIEDRETLGKVMSSLEGVKEEC